MPQAGFEPPSVDDTSYEADALPTKLQRQELKKLKTMKTGLDQFQGLH